jgi:hypothetical protein
MGVSVAGALLTSTVSVNGVCGVSDDPHARCMWILLILLLLVWAGLAVLGFLVEGLLWLAVLGIVLFLATVVVGMLRGRAATKE